MTCYYNEIDPVAAAWLRNLIAAGHIAPGDVDERSIEDVRPDELVGYTQCHFFAGVGIWSYALRAAGISDDTRVWTGSCPCQPFSAAGEGDGFDDERHLWPAFFHLIEQCKPAIVLGEQVASKNADPWVDLVCHDLEAVGYAFGAVPFPAAGVGAPHIRDRLYWVASDGVALGDTIGKGLEGLARHGHDSDEPGRVAAHPAGSVAAASSAGRLALTIGERHDGRGTAGTAGTAVSRRLDAAGCSAPSVGMADAESRGLGIIGGALEPQRGNVRHIDGDGDGDAPGTRPGPVNGFWRAADWLACRDGKWRPVEPGTFPLAHGAPARVGRLRAYGNAINASQAEIFIRCAMESMSE
jgi:DNA (cytosine-5)-methyltransferase 1